MDRREERLARLEQWTEWPLTVLALLFIPILLAPHVLRLSAATLSTLDGLDYLIWGIFAADFVGKLAIAPRRLAYVRTHWIDALLVALPVLRPIRVVRSVRALRLLRAGRASAALLRVLFASRALLVRHGLHYVLLAVVLFVFLGGALGVAFERDDPNASIRTLPDGLWWAITTATTVGYGDMYPRTPAGRGVGVVLMLVGIGLFGALTANLAAYFVEQQEDETLREVRRLCDEIARLRAELERRQE